MKREYDFSQGERGAPIKVGPGKTRITIRIDDDILAWFKRAAHDQGGGNYQTMVNAALRDHIDTRKEHLEQTLRRVIREELPRELKRAASQ
jgi:predicted DNA binding CopG/RHH family protein